jgi:hypothetical protein
MINGLINTLRKAIKLEQWYWSIGVLEKYRIYQHQFLKDNTPTRHHSNTPLTN